ncbi:uncharacterized protein LOC123526841 isoform X2 [Mercenaria mercenaria]|uniref:uncharacterized protein LOC123526841 isoform X2 n=1 Tax=Mercenaria mercenaria TaxID=6596 RepID=UPI00234FAA09|nr:uncharacterized protein LOC123526841 isoform X2 [Mercenaria mercenaria]
MVAFGRTNMRRKQRKPGKSIGEPFPVKSSRKNNVLVKESSMDTGDNSDTDLKMDTDEKTYTEDNNNDVTDLDIETKIGKVVDGKGGNLPAVSIMGGIDQSEEESDIIEENSENMKTAINDSDVENDFQNRGLLEKLIINSPGIEDNEKLEVPKCTLVSVINETGSSEKVPSVQESVDFSLPANKEDLCVPDALNIKLPVISEILDSAAVSGLSNSSQDSRTTTPSNSLVTPVTVEKPKAPYKGTMVPCGSLKDYLDSLPTFNRKCMLRKGREVHKIYVDMTKGETFLDDQFAYTEFGRMVLTNGSIRAGRAKNAKQIVVARETLYCSGTAACKRACGGYGICLPGCDKTKMRGHRCSYRIKLTQRLGFVNFWFVEELGSHDQLNGKDCDFKVNSQLAANAASTGNKDNAVMDLSSGFKFRAANIPRTPKKLAPKSTTPSPDRSHSQLNGGANQSVSDNSNSDIHTNYHYVLGTMPTSSPSRDSPSKTLSCVDSDSSQSSSQQHSAINIHTDTSSIQPSNLAAVTVTGATSIQQDVASQLFQANFINYMSTMTNLGIGAALQGAINPLLVNIKQEPQDNLQGQLAVNQGQVAISQGQGQLAVGYPGIVTLPSQIQLSTSQITDPSQSLKSHSPSPSRGQGHSPSPSRGQGYRDRSPLVREQGQSSSVQKGLEIEAKIKNESSRKMQAQQEVLGQVHNRIMERAKCRKSAHTMRVPQKSDCQILDFSKRSPENDSKQVLLENLNIPNVPSSSSSSSSSSLVGGVPQNSHISSVAFQRFQTLNRVLQSDAFQAAKNQLEKKKTLVKNGDSQDDTSSPLNLIVKPPKPENSNLSNESHQQYFRLAEEWKKGEQLPTSWIKGEQLVSEWTKGEQLNEKELNGEQLLNGHSDILDCKAILETDKLTDNEKELMCRVRQLESHVKQLQNIVIRKDVSTSQPVAGRRKSKPLREIDFNKYNTRHVALKVMYLGYGYQGYASQEDSDKTIEHALFEALKKTRLIESRETSCYHRCGRTDKGVSAFSQVISLDLRTNLLSGVGVKVREGGTAAERPGDKTTEIQYCHILNKNLPPEIRALAWAPVDPEFSSRFSCKKRTYKYFFPKGSLNIEIMDQAAKKLIGEHDFRNLCKQDIAGGVTNFVRKILSAEIKVLDETDQGGYTMCELTIVGTAFLYHQIRCIVSVLFLVGKEQESPEVIDELLNVEKNPKKPQFNMSSDIPLCLYDANFGDEFEWIHEAYWHEDNIKTLQQLWAEHSIKATMLKKMLEDLDKAKVETECDIAPWSDLSPPVLHQADWIFPDKSRVYRPLLEREKGAFTVEEKIENFAKKRKLNPDSEKDSTDKEGE